MEENLSNHYYPPNTIESSMSVVPSSLVISQSSSVLALLTRDPLPFESRQVVQSETSYECPVPTLCSSHTD